MVYWCTELISLDDDGPRVNHEPRVRLFKRPPKYIFDEVSFFDFNEIPNAELKEKIDRMHRNSQFKRDILHVPAYCPYIPDLTGIEEEVIELEF